MSPLWYLIMESLIARPETDSSPLLFLLRGKIRVKYLGKVLSWDSDAVVLDYDSDIAAFLEEPVVHSDDDVLGYKIHHPSVRHRFFGIDNHVFNNIADLYRINFRRPEVFGDGDPALDFRALQGPVRGFPQ